MNNPQNLKKLFELVERMDSSSQKLIGKMEEQIDAIIGSDVHKIEVLSDEFAKISSFYKNCEEEFIYTLNSIFQTGEKSSSFSRLIDLKKQFPEASAEVDYWHGKLSENAVKLQNKHAQVIQLLEFAMKQNARLMHALYSKHNEKNMHYAANGDRSSVLTGLAVNQEA